MSQLLATMNNKQQEAIVHTNGPLLVMAGAGSGKTRVLTHRIAYLLEERGVNPWQILAITFTNKAAREMRDRLEILIGNRSLDMWICTFHAMCVRILRREAQAIGYPRQFTIIDPSEQKILMSRILKDKNLDEKKFNTKFILAYISDCKNNLVTVEEAKLEAVDWMTKVLVECYEAYQEQLQKNALFDFDDLIMQTVLLFKNRPDILEQYQQKFQYIHVDEYQDTNKAQYELVLQLSHYYQNICVVGDADQSIYGWRGADITNILNFERDFPAAKTVLLEQNYRSTQTILDAANDVISNNNDRVVKQLWTENGDGDKIYRYKAFSESDEASFVATQAKQLLEDGQYAFKDMVVLYRANAQSRAIEEALMKHQIPYQIVGGLKFYDRAEIKDLLAYLRLVANVNDDLSFTRIINVPKRSIGKTSVEKIQQFAAMHGISLFKAAQNVSVIGLTKKATESVLSFVRLIESIQEHLDIATMTEIVQLIIDKTGYVDELMAEASIESQARIENIKEFQSVTTVFDEQYEQLNDEELPKIVQFLTDFALDNNVEEQPKEVGMTLMTLHAAKGLEFPIVFLVGLEESIFPSYRSLVEDDIEEERRLMYVGITRAEKKLYLTNASSRLLYGQTQRNKDSRFIEEIHSERMMPIGSVHRYQNASNVNSNSNVKTSSWVQKSVVSQTNQSSVMFSVGEKVKHQKFGIGTIVRISGQEQDRMLDVAFDGQGIKTLLASFAPIEKV